MRCPISTCGVVTGNGGIFVDFELERGANGATAGYAFILKKRGAIASDAQRNRGTALSETARAEVDYLLSRLNCGL